MKRRKQSARSEPDSDAEARRELEEELRAKLAAADRTWGLSKFGRWDLDQGQGRLRLSQRPDGAVAEARAQIIGSFDRLSATWMWAWANRSVAKTLTKHALVVREFGRKHGIEMLLVPCWRATEEDCRMMTALAVRLNRAPYAFRGPSGRHVCFMTLGRPKLSNRSGRSRTRRASALTSRRERTEVGDLPADWKAERARPGAPWKRRKIRRDPPRGA